MQWAEFLDWLIPVDIMTKNCRPVNVGIVALGRIERMRETQYKQIAILPA